MKTYILIDLKTEIHILQPSDIGNFIELISVFETVFEMGDVKRPNDTYLQKLLNKESFLAIVAKINKKVIGGLTIYVLDQYYSEKPLAYIYDLAVLTAYQRKGVGRELIKYANEICQLKGFEEVFVQVEKVDDYAIDFYRSTKPTDEEPVIYFSYK